MGSLGIFLVRVVVAGLFFLDEDAACISPVFVFVVVRVAGAACEGTELVAGSADLADFSGTVTFKVEVYCIFKRFLKITVIHRI